MAKVSNFKFDIGDAVFTRHLNYIVKTEVVSKGVYFTKENDKIEEARHYGIKSVIPQATDADKVYPETELFATVEEAIEYFSAPTRGLAVHLNAETSINDSLVDILKASLIDMTRPIEELEKQAEENKARYEKENTSK